MRCMDLPSRAYGPFLAEFRNVDASMNSTQLEMHERCEWMTCTESGSLLVPSTTSRQFLPSNLSCRGGVTLRCSRRPPRRPQREQRPQMRLSVVHELPAASTSSGRFSSMHTLTSCPSTREVSCPPLPARVVKPGRVNPGLRQMPFRAPRPLFFMRHTCCRHYMCLARTPTTQIHPPLDACAWFGGSPSSLSVLLSDLGELTAAVRAFLSGAVDEFCSPFLPLRSP